MFEEYNWILFIATGMWTTLQYSIISVSLGLIVGTLISLARLTQNRFLSGFAKFYVSIIRGTPLLLQLSIVHYAIPSLTGYNTSIFCTGIITFSINSGAYISEIIRSGINNVDRGQFEAARALGIPRWAMLRDIILPQAFSKIIPPLVNEIVNMIKESSIIAVFGEQDIMRRAQLIGAEQYTYLAPLLVAGACYYILVSILSMIANKIEAGIRAKNQ